MDVRLHEWMVPTIYRLAAWCDEPLIAAGPFLVVGGGRLPEDVILAVGETKLFVFAHEIGEDLSIAVEAPVREWWRKDVVARGDVDAVPIGLTIDITSSGDRHELVSTATTGMPGKATREILRLLADPMIGVPEPGPSPKEIRARLGEIAGEIEAELKRLRWWMPDPPSEETVVAGGPFGMRVVPLAVWLQVVFVKRLRQVASGELEIPATSSVGAAAWREFDGREHEAGDLLMLLSEVDRLVEGRA